jgi:hypothetical protein
MFFSRFGNRSVYSLTVTEHNSLPLFITMPDGSSIPAPTQSDGEEWKEVYRQAFKQLVEGYGPSAFRRATRPSDN